MPIQSESSTPPPRIAKIGPYTVFVTPPAAPSATPRPNSPRKLDPVEDPIQKPVQPPKPPPVMAPPAQFYKEKPSSFAFIWDAVAKVQNAHATLDEQVAHWFGLNQSKYQWALDDYYETNGKVEILYQTCNYKSALENFNEHFTREVEISHAANLELRLCGKSCIRAEKYSTDLNLGYTAVLGDDCSILLEWTIGHNHCVAISKIKLLRFLGGSCFGQNQTEVKTQTKPGKLENL